jgi:hypothetical protein
MVNGGQSPPDYDSLSGQVANLFMQSCNKYETKVWFSYGHNGRKNRVTTFLNGQFIFSFYCPIEADFLHFFTQNFS